MIDDTQDDEITRGMQPFPQYLLEPDPPDEGGDSLLLSARNLSEWASRPGVAPSLEVEMPPPPAPALASQTLRFDAYGLCQRLWCALLDLCRVC